MSKYIDADALKVNVEEMEVFVDANDFESNIDYRMLAYLLERIEKSLLGIIDNMEAADVAPVIRCKNCRYSEVFGWRRFCKGKLCFAAYALVTDDDFCSQGERKK